jgi:hypothetical protein
MINAITLVYIAFYMIWVNIRRLWFDFRKGMKYLHYPRLLDRILGPVQHYEGKAAGARRSQPAGVEIGNTQSFTPLRNHSLRLGG